MWMCASTQHTHNIHSMCVCMSVCIEMVLSFLVLSLPVRLQTLPAPWRNTWTPNTLLHSPPPPPTHQPPGELLSHTLTASVCECVCSAGVSACRASTSRPVAFTFTFKSASVREKKIYVWIYMSDTPKVLKLLYRNIPQRKQVTEIER